MSNNLKLINTNTINSKPIRNYIKVKNTGGPKGDTGATGATGPQGPQGPAGQAATINIGETTTLLPGQTATVTNTGTQQNATLNFGIPQGLRGPTGAQGPKGDTGPQGLKGDKGDAGAAATIQVNATNTGAPGTNAQVTNIGNEHFAQLNFTIPRGATGATGAQGPQGPQGPQGEKGDDGAAATVTVGTTTTTNPGTSATVTNSGTTSAAVLNFGIPRGATGSVKSEVVSELPESGEGDTFYLVNREAETQTATGKAINFTNNENAGDITDAQIDGETSQNGTPTPSAPVPVNTVTGENVVKIAGKNIWTLASSFQNTSSSAAWVLTDTAVSFQPGTYTFSCTSTASSDVNFIAYKYADNVDHNIAFKDVVSLTFESEVKKIAILLGGNVSISNIQLELGSTATTYEPYQDQSYELNLGKNLINFDSFQQSWDGASVEGEGTTITMGPNTSGTMGLLYDSTTYSLSIPAGRTITWSRTWAGGGTFESGTFTFPLKLTYSDGTTETLSFGDTTAENYNQVISASKTLAKSVVSVKIESGGCFGITNLSAPTSFNLQLEYGSQATSYAAYFEPIELCKIGDYQDYIWNDNGTWKKHKTIGKLIFNGTEDWSDTSGNTPFYTTFSPAAVGNCCDGLCSHFRNLKAYPSSSGYFALRSDGTSASFNNSSTATLAAWKTWLGSNNVSVYYPLATPTDTEITNEALVAQLDNLASAALYSGVNNIFTVTPNEVPTLELDYVTYDKYNQNKVYIWNDDLQQWQIIVQ